MLQQKTFIPECSLEVNNFSSCHKKKVFVKILLYLDFSALYFYASFGFEVAAIKPYIEH